MDTREFWSGDFNLGYIERNSSDEMLASNLFFFAKILFDRNLKPKTILELGANVGLNIRALQLLLPNTRFDAVEINRDAFEKLKETGCEAHLSSIEDFDSRKKYDLVLSKGVLIHIEPQELQKVYKKIVDLSKKWILIAEYFSRTPTEVVYHGEEGKLFKRDFARELMDTNNVSLVASGFSSKLMEFPQDDLNWYLFEKNEMV